MPSPPTTPLPAGARRELLGTLALALKLVAERILPQAGSANDVAELAARAEELAAEAWTIGGSRVPDPARAAALQAEFRTFIEEAAALSARAAQAAAAVRTVGEAIGTHGRDLANLAQSPEADDIAVLRARLRPMMATLEQLPQRIADSNALAEDVAAMGPRAEKLGQDALAAQGHRIPASEKALALYRSLRAIAEEAGTVAATLLAESQQLRGTMAEIATRVGQIATPGAAATTTAQARLSQVVAHGTGAAPPPAAALDWGIGRKA